MKVSVSKKEARFFCPKCGEKIELNMEKIDYLISSNIDIMDNIIGTKIIIENILKDYSMNFLKKKIKVRLV